jgi:hypothetical protein
MPSFISIDGVWKPAQEKAVDTRTAEIYEGPDREAVKFIAMETGQTVQEVLKNGSTIGMDALEDPEMYEVAKKHGFNTVADYMKAKAPSAKVKEEIKVARSKVVTHQPEPKKVGVDTGTKGGFHDENSNPVNEFNKKS